MPASRARTTPGLSHRTVCASLAVGLLAGFRQVIRDRERPWSDYGEKGAPPPE